MKKKTGNILRVIFIGVILLAAVMKLVGGDKSEPERGRNCADREDYAETVSEFDEVW